MAATPEPADAVRAPAKNIIEALTRVMDELPGIERSNRSDQGYNYRGIELITRHVQGLFAKHGIVTAPRVKQVTMRELTVNNRPWTEHEVHVGYRFYGPGGTQDYIDVELVGLGRDNSDKGTNKALTQAYKYALIQTLCIGDGKDDADQQTHEADAKAVQCRVDPTCLRPDGHEGTCVDRHKLVRGRLADRIKDLDADAKAALGAYADANGIPRVTKDMSDEQVEQITKYLDDPTSAGSPPETPQDERTDESAPEPAPEAETAQEGAVEACTTTPGCVRDMLHDGPCVDDNGEPLLNTATRRGAATAYVNGIDKVTLLSELGGRNVKAKRDEMSQRLQLIDALVEDESWTPPAS